MGSRLRGLRLRGLWSRRQSFGSRREVPEDRTIDARPPIVPGFVTEGLLGLGGTGEVWAARSDPTGQLVALKRLRVNADAAAREGLRREGELLATFRHPHVIGFHGLRHDGEGLVLVLERAATSLSAVVSSRGPLDPAEAVGIMAPIADALAAAHALGLVHGDVSPANVLLRSDGHPLLADLGTAKILAACDGPTGRISTTEPFDSTAPVTSVGSAASAGPFAPVGPFTFVRRPTPTVPPAPAAFHPTADTFGTAGFADRAATHATAAGDVYSLAAVLAYALSGRVFGSGPGAARRWANMAHSGRIPTALVSAVGEVLASEPARRVDAAGLATRFRAAVSPQPLRLGVEFDGYEPVGIGTARGQTVGVSGDLSISEKLRISEYPALSDKLNAFETNPAFALPVTSRAHGTGTSAGDGKSPSKPRISTFRRWLSARRIRQAVLAILAVVVLGAGVMALGPPAWSEFGADPGAGRDAEARNRRLADSREWAAIMNGLDEARGLAFATANVDELHKVYAPRSVMHDSDRQRLVELRNLGVVVIGIRHRFSDVRLLERAGTVATIRLTEQLEPHSVVRVGIGRRANSAPVPEVIRAVAAGKQRVVTVQLGRTDGRWRIVTLMPDR